MTKVKELSRAELAGVKRVYQSCKALRRKRNILFRKINELAQEAEMIEKMIATWETPIVEMTGMTSNEVIAVMTKQEEVEEIQEPVATDLEVVEMPDPSLDNFPVNDMSTEIEEGEENQSLDPNIEEEEIVAE